MFYVYLNESYNVYYKFLFIELYLGLYYHLNDIKI